MDVSKKTPKYVCCWWMWYCACEGAVDTSSSLPENIFYKLNRYGWSGLCRGYITHWGAMRALKRAVKRARKQGINE